MKHFNLFFNGYFNPLTPRFSLFLLAALYFCIFFTLSVLKHQALHSTYLDLGLQSQSIWNTSQGRFFEVSFGENGALISTLSYHVNPIIILIAPLYRLWPDPILLLLIQTLVLVLGALPVYWLARDVFKADTSEVLGDFHLEGGKQITPRGRAGFLPLAFAVSYLLYPPIQYANLFDFHPETLSTTLLLFTFWFLYKKRYRFFFLFAFLSILCKENVALAVAMMGVYEVLRTMHYKLQRTCGSSYKGSKRLHLGIFIFLFSVFWFLGCVYVIMPHFSGGKMGAVGRYSWLGETPLEIIKNFILHAIQDIKVLLVAPKIKYMFHLLVSAGFLPLFAPQYLALALPEFWLNLFSEYNPMWQVKFHYTSAITPFVFIAAIFGARKLLRWVPSLAKEHLGGLQGGGTCLAGRRVGEQCSFFIGIYLIATSLLWNFMHSPSPLYRKFDPSVYEITPEARQTREILKTIPQNASVSAINNLGAHLSTRCYLYRFPIGVGKADYIVVDPKMPGENFDYAQVGEEEFAELISGSKVADNYEKVVELERLLILKRKEP